MPDATCRSTRSSWGAADGSSRDGGLPTAVEPTDAPFGTFARDR
ncbi:hypothetical protein ACFPN0_28125 [Kitasatospora cinereorecta]